MRFREFSEEERFHMRAALGPMFMTRQCVALAVAVHRRTGWPIVAVRGSGGELQHAGFRDPGGMACDARGPLPDDQFRFPWGGAVGPSDEATLLAEDPKIDAEAIERPGAVAGLLFPGLPGTSAREERLRAFADGLEALCRDTGVWIRFDGPFGIPVYDAHGDEGEFVVSFGASGDARIERTLSSGK